MRAPSPNKAPQRLTCLSQTAASCSASRLTRRASGTEDREIPLVTVHRPFVISPPQSISGDEAPPSPSSSPLSRGRPDVCERICHSSYGKSLSDQPLVYPLSRTPCNTGSRHLSPPALDLPAGIETAGPESRVSRSAARRPLASRCHRMEKEGHESRREQIPPRCP